MNSLPPGSTTPDGVFDKTSYWFIDPETSKKWELQFRYHVGYKQRVGDWIDAFSPVFPADTRNKARIIVEEVDVENWYPSSFALAALQTAHPEKDFIKKQLGSIAEIRNKRRESGDSHGTRKVTLGKTFLKGLNEKTKKVGRWFNGEA